MTMENKPDMTEIYVAGRRVYLANEVFAQNYDGVLLAKDAWECEKYILAPAERDGVGVEINRGKLHDAFWKAFQQLEKPVRERFSLHIGRTMANRICDIYEGKSDE